jgi:hypothetical protein
MDLTSSVRTDTLPAVASVLVPGAFASAPYVAVLFSKKPAVATFLASHEATSLFAGVLVAVGSGFLIESLGSYLEYYWIDSRHSNRADMLAKWWRYLRIAWKVEPTGQHYLRRILAVFKFELNGCVASVAALPGLLWLGCARATPVAVSAAMVLGTLLVGIYTFHAATETSRLLANIRDQLLRGVGEPPFDDPAG